MELCREKCSKCGEEFQKPVGRHGRVCRKCKNARQRVTRSKDDNVHTRVYEKTPKGYLMRTYRNMKSRVTGVLKSKAHLYEGLDILPLEDFYAWGLTDPDFMALFRDWTVAGWPMTLSPSIDRIDTAEGYVLGNIRWLTHSENSRLGSLSNHKKVS